MSQFRDFTVPVSTPTLAVDDTLVIPRTPGTCEESLLQRFVSDLILELECRLSGWYSCVILAVTVRDG
jgi:hypothetical protein